MARAKRAGPEDETMTHTAQSGRRHALHLAGALIGLAVWDATSYTRPGAASHLARDHEKIEERDNLST